MLIATLKTEKSKNLRTYYPNVLHTYVPTYLTLYCTNALIPIHLTTYFTAPEPTHTSREGTCDHYLPEPLETLQ